MFDKWIFRYSFFPPSTGIIGQSKNNWMPLSGWIELNNNGHRCIFFCIGKKISRWIVVIHHWVHNTIFQYSYQYPYIDNRIYVSSFFFSGEKNIGQREITIPIRNDPFRYPFAGSFKCIQNIHWHAFHMIVPKKNLLQCLML